MALSDERKQALERALNKARNKYEDLKAQNDQIERKNRKLADDSSEGKRYYAAKAKYEKRSSQNLLARRIIVVLLIIVSAVAALTVGMIFAWNIVINNLYAIKSPIENDYSGWTDENYGVLYTLGIVLFVAAVMGIITLAVGDTANKKSIYILGWVYIALAIISYISLIIYTMTYGQGADKVLGIFMILVVPLTLPLAIFNCSGLGDQYLAMMPSILAILLTLAAIGGVYILIVHIIQTNAKNIKKVDGKLEALKKEMDEAYHAYSKVYEQFKKKNPLLSTKEIEEEILDYRRRLRQLRGSFGNSTGATGQSVGTIQTAMGNTQKSRGDNYINYCARLEEERRLQKEQERNNRDELKRRQDCFKRFTLDLKKAMGWSYSSNYGERVLDFKYSFSISTWSDEFNVSVRVKVEMLEQYYDRDSAQNSVRNYLMKYIQEDVRAQMQKAGFLTDFSIELSVEFVAR
ncbi:MAG: hypothetical protein J6D30_02915 [Clostridia bacterium]|nr:hypothetical protein [Clostridia bacterium]